nr:glycosyltransferase [Oculatella sp. LEGE 06141]
MGRESVVSIPNGVPDISLPTPLPSRSDEALVVGSVGRLDRMKAHDVLLRAIAQVDGVRVVILGDGDERSPLETLANQLGVSDRVELPGWVENPRLLLPEFDAIALPSRSEGFPLAMVEAMLAARPVIASRVGSMAEAVIDGQTGLLVEKDSVEGLAHALIQLRDDPALRQRLGQQGREVAVARFTVQQMTTRYEQLWRSLQTTPPTPRLRVPRPRD